MKYFSKLRLVMAMAVFTLAIAMTGITSEAKVISKKAPTEKSVSYIGSTFSTGSCQSLKINKKAASKLKKKVKTLTTSKSASSFSYRTKSYFSTSSAYATYSDYTNATTNATKYVSTASYELRFLKTGTYTISYVTYEKQSLSAKSDKYDSKTKTYYYKIWDNNNGQALSSELFARKTLSGSTYYEGVTSHTIYASGSEGLVQASVSKDVNGTSRLFYQPQNVIKTTHTCQVKVLKTSNVISSVQLGTRKVTVSDKLAAYSSTSSSTTTSRFLSGNSGKLTVKLANSNYSITSIIVLTYNSKGEPVYTKVSNKKKINYGLYKAGYSYKSSYSNLQYSYSSMYKPTTIYIGYKNKFTGAYSKFDIVTDSSGAQQIKTTYRNAGDTKDQNITGFAGSYQSYTFYKN